MVWQKKAAAPDFARFLDRVKADVTGTPEAWTLPFLDQLSDYVVDVNAFCAAGPEECDSLDALDFLGFLPRPSWLGAGLTVLSLQDKLACFGRNRLFGAWCENVVPAGQYGNETCYRVDKAPAQNDVTRVTVDKPAGATHLKTRCSSTDGVSGSRVFYCQVIWLGLTSGDPHPMDYIGPQNPNAVYTLTIPPGTTAVQFNNYDWVMGGTVCTQWDGGGTAPYVPPTVVQPPTAIGPEPKVYVDIPDLGRELDSIEQKLHSLVYGVTQLQVSDFPVVHEPVSAPVDATNTEVPLEEDVIGVLITTSNVGPFADERFGLPVALHRLGRVVIGTVNGWGRPIDITVSPMLIWDLPPKPTRIVAYAAPPATVTVQPLRRAVGPVG